MFGNRRGSTEILADSRIALDEIAEALGNGAGERHADWPATSRASTARIVARAGSETPTPGQDDKNHRMAIFEAIRAIADPDAIGIVDGGGLLGFARIGLPMRTFMDSVAFGCRGVGVPFAVAAALTHPGPQVVSVSSFLAQPGSAAHRQGYAPRPQQAKRPCRYAFRYVDHGRGPECGHELNQKKRSATPDAAGRPAPLQAGRVESLNVLRGVAVLGILIINIQAFSMPEAAYLNPTMWGELTGINLAACFFGHLFADTKFITIFSMLFGAVVRLFADRAEARGGNAASLHYQRMFRLLVFGLAHAYLPWIGDILAPYAVCGCLVFLLRKSRPPILALTGIALFSASTLLHLLIGLAPVSGFLPPEAVADMRTEWWAPTEAYLLAEVDAYRGGWAEQQSWRAEGSLAKHLCAFPLVRKRRLADTSKSLLRCRAVAERGAIPRTHRGLRDAAPDVAQPALPSGPLLPRPEG